MSYKVEKPERRRKMKESGGHWHVYPAAEEKLHRLIGFRCKCGPEVKSGVVVHNYLKPEKLN
jgi:hypothetical protein